jgi:hypothetical protein
MWRIFHESRPTLNTNVVEGINNGSVAVRQIEDNCWMVPIQHQLIASSLRKVLQRLHYPLEVM